MHMWLLLLYISCGDKLAPVKRCRRLHAASIMHHNVLKDPVSSQVKLYHFCLPLATMSPKVFTYTGILQILDENQIHLECAFDLVFDAIAAPNSDPCHTECSKQPCQIATHTTF